MNKLKTMRNFVILIVLNCLFVTSVISQTVSTSNLNLGIGNINTTVNVPIIAINMENYGAIYTATIRVEYNPDVLVYLGYVNLNNVISSNSAVTTNPSGNGVVQLNILANSSFVFPNGTAYELQFTYKGGNSSLSITTAEFLDENFDTQNAVVSNGSAIGPTVAITSNTVGGNWDLATTWDLNHVPNATNHVIIASAPGNPVLVNTDATVSGNLTINSGAALTVESGKALTISGDLLIKSDASGTGSFINNGTYTAANTTVERYITGYNPLADPADGWRFVSSPVGNTAIGNFAPAANEDFFKYNEVTDTWENYAVSAFGFTKGMGYLAAYASSGTKSFTGTLNNTDVTFTNLTKTFNHIPDTMGWHLLGNPFASAIKWNKDGGDWALSNVYPTAKVLNTGGTYTDVNANDYIPAMQGFLIQLVTGTNSITIPASSRDHSNANIANKSTIAENLKLTVSSIGNNSYVESIIKTDASATNGFDSDYDANFLSGMYGTPQLYSKVGNYKLSTNVLPTINNNVVMVPVSFIAGSATNYKLTADGINTFNCSAITLVDLKTNTSHNLMANPVYSFTATASDNANRFQLYFNSAVGIDENNQVNSTIYSYGNEIYVSSANAIRQISIYNTLGQLIHTANNPQGLFKYSLNNNSTNYYIVKVITDKNVNSEKVFVK